MDIRSIVGLIVFYLLCGCAAWIVTLVDVTISMYRYCKQRLPEGIDIYDVLNEVLNRVESSPLYRAAKLGASSDRFVNTVRIIVLWPYYSQGILGLRTVFMDATKEVVGEKVGI